MIEYRQITSRISLRSSLSWEKRCNNICQSSHANLKPLFESFRLHSRSRGSHSGLTVMVCVIRAAAVMCFCIPVCVCTPQGQWVTDSLLVCGPLQWKLQGQAVEGRAGDLSLRIELISLVSHRPLPSACRFILKVTIISLSACISFRWWSRLSFCDICIVDLHTRDAHFW